MILVTPSQALTKLILFYSRVDRLEANNYSNPRFRTQDLNKLKFELQRIRLYASIAIHNKNKERAQSFISMLSSKYIIADKIRNNEL